MKKLINIFILLSASIARSELSTPQTEFHTIAEISKVVPHDITPFNPPVTGLKVDASNKFLNENVLNHKAKMIIKIDKIERESGQLVIRANSGGAHWRINAFFPADKEIILIKLKPGFNITVTGIITKSWFGQYGWLNIDLNGCEIVK